MRTATHSLQTFLFSLAPLILFNTNLIASKFTRRIPAFASFQSILNYDHFSFAYLDAMQSTNATRKEWERSEREKVRKRLLAMPRGGDLAQIEEVVATANRADANIATVSGWIVDEDKNPKHLRVTGPDLTPSMIAVDEAILYSLSRLSSDDLRIKFADNILLCGGVAKTKGINTFLQKRLTDRIRSVYPNIENVTVRDLEQKDPKMSGEPVNRQLLSWKGAACLAVSDASRDLWIDSHEWEIHGPRILRGKFPFLW